MSRTKIFILVYLFLFIQIVQGQNFRIIFSDSIVNAIKNNQPLPWLTVAEMEEFVTNEEKKTASAELQELRKASDKVILRFRSYLTDDSRINFVHANPVGNIYQVDGSMNNIVLFLRVVENKRGALRLLSLEIDTTGPGLSYCQMGKKFEEKNEHICILYYQRALQLNLSVYEKRMMYQYMAGKASYNGQYEDAIWLYKKIIETDADTFLVAADAYRWIALIYKYNLEDSVHAISAENMALSYLDMSINLFPNNIPAYIDKLRFYKYSAITKGKDEFVHLLEDKYKDEWKILFALAMYYMKGDFLFDDHKNKTKLVSLLKRTIELNPTHFNAYLLLSSDNSIPEKEKLQYLKKMYSLAPKQFKNSTSKVPYQVESLNRDELGKDLFIGITKQEMDLIKAK